MNLNKITLIGRVTKEVELQTTQGGSSIVKFGLATNHNYKNSSGEKVEKVTFHNIIAFGKVAKVLAQYVVKGQELYLDGRQENRSYDKSDGTKGYASEVILENFQFGQRPKGAKMLSNGQEEFEEYARENHDSFSPEDVPF